MRTIGIDCRLAGRKHAGIGRYIVELVSRVILDPNFEWVLFVHDADQMSLPKQKNVRVVIAPVTHYSLAEQLRMPKIFAREKLDLLHVPHYNVPIAYSGPFIVTIHDLLWHTETRAQATTLSPLLHRIKHAAYLRVVSHAVTKAQTVVVPTKVVKQDILRFFPQLSAETIVPIAEGVNEIYLQAGLKPDPVDKPEKILFYTGSLYPHKNVLRVVKALEKLPGYTLAVSSSRSVFVESFLKEVQALGLGSRVTYLGRLSDEELVYWYRKSTALVQPSYSEGFGLTGVEALAVGLPLLASDIPVFHEVYGSAFEAFDPNSEASLVTALGRIERRGRQAYSELGKRQAASYSWDKLAEAMLKLYS